MAGPALSKAAWVAEVFLDEGSGLGWGGLHDPRGPFNRLGSLCADAGHISALVGWA